MTIVRTSLRRNLRRGGRLVAAFAGLLALTLAWAPAATAATTSAPTAGHAQHATAGLSPGDPIFGPGGTRCTLGFNVTDGDTVYIITAGHCTSAVSYWYADPQGTVPIGPTVSSSFPGNDFGLIRYDYPELAAPGPYTAGSPYVGQQVYTITPETGMHSGTVTALNATVNYGGGNVVYGLIRTNLCVEGSVGGAPLIGDGKALGIGSGASGSCSSGGTSFFQPLTEILSSTGLTLY